LAVIINIETATAVCSIALGVDGHVKTFKEEMEGRSHSSHLTVFIEQMLKDTGTRLQEIDAISVSKGPGSFTGLRIGVSVAKGLCFSLGLPLIAIDTLQSMAVSGIRNFLNPQKDVKRQDHSQYHFCPMIDARRMEVYSAIYDLNLNVIRGVEANIVDSTSYSNYLGNNKVLFFGDGMNKCKETLQHQKNAIFLDGVLPSATDMVLLSERDFKEGNFQDMAYFEPYYLKDFMPGLKK